MPVARHTFDTRAALASALAGTIAAQLNTLGARELCPGKAALDRINAALR